MWRVRRLLTPGWSWWLVALVILIVVVPPLRAVMERGLNSLGRPIFGFSQWLSQQVKPQPTVSSLERERDALRAQVDDLTSRLAEAEQKLELSTAIDQLTAYVAKTRRPSVLAGVIAYNPEPGVESMVINRGSDDGLQVGMPAVTANGFLVGKVQTVHQRTSIILLLADSHLTVAARIQNPAQSPGIVSGERGLAVEMNYIPKNDDIQPGQTVVTAGTESLIPPNIVIGVIRASVSRAGELFRRATVVSPVQLSQIRVVAVMTAQP